MRGKPAAIGGILALALLVMLATGVVLAAASPASGTDYVVQAGDWLARISAQHYGDWKLYPAIVLASKAKAAEDSSYASISDPYLIYPDWKLSIPSAEDAQSGLTVTTLENAEYQSTWTASRSALLVDGQYTEDIVPGSASKINIFLLERMAFGYSVEGQPFGAVILATNAGGSGTFIDLAVVVEQDGKLVNAATAPLGDRAQINSLAIADGKITVDMITHGQEDPMCCPTQQVVQTYELQVDELVQVSSEVLGAGDASEVTGMTWKWWGLVETEPASQSVVPDPEYYTLAFSAEGSVSLKADCNQAMGTYALEGKSLTIELGPSTRAYCGEESLEQQYLALLASVESYALENDQLVLYLKDNAGHMIFERGESA